MCIFSLYIHSNFTYLLFCDISAMTVQIKGYKPDASTPIYRNVSLYEPHQKQGVFNDAVKAV